MARILIIDDEAQIRKFLRISLGANGYEVIEAKTGREGIDIAKAGEIDLAIIDLGLPDIDGHEVVSAIRKLCQTPMIVLSVRADEMDKVEALDRGANDYVVKPFGIGELMARVRAALRTQSSPETSQIFDIGGLKLDFEHRRITRDGVEIKLSKKEYDLLRHLAQTPDHVLTHKEILTAIWGPAHTEDTAYLRVYINQLRQKLEVDPTTPVLILTEPGVGYRFRL